MRDEAHIYSLTDTLAFLQVTCLCTILKCPTDHVTTITEKRGQLISENTFCFVILSYTSYRRAHFLYVIELYRVFKIVCINTLPQKSFKRLLTQLWLRLGETKVYSIHLLWTFDINYVHTIDKRVHVLFVSALFLLKWYTIWLMMKHPYK